MMLVRVVRAVIGTGLLLVGLPLLLAGGALWFGLQHQDPAGGFTAPLAPVSTEGYAVVASDVDALLRREAPFTRSGRTTLRVTARTAAGPAFVGLARPADVARYLAGVPHTRLDRVRLARGPLPVATTPVNGVAEPAAGPGAQPFWRTSSDTGTLEWSPSELRGERLALVVMDPQARAPVRVDLSARVHPQWLDSTTLGLLGLGTVLLLVAVVALAWPSRPREIVYVVPPAQLPEIAAHLGVPVPRAAAEAPAEPAGPPEPATPAGSPSSAPACPAPATCSVPIGSIPAGPLAADPVPAGPVPASSAPDALDPAPADPAAPAGSATLATAPADPAASAESVTPPEPATPAAPEPRAPEAPPHPPSPVAGKPPEWPPPPTAHPLPTASPTPVPVPPAEPAPADT